MVVVAEALIDWEEVKNRGERRAVLTALDKLAQLGPLLTPPHVKTLSGADGLLELRPRQGQSAVRPIVARVGPVFLVLAFSADHGKGMGRDIDRAAARLKAYRTATEI
ncbi:MAG: type II toxin-antitoxin system RelE/ParE family toxin [Patulibacter sp.]